MRTVLSSDLDEVEVGVTGGKSFEGEGSDVSLPGDAGDAGWTGAGDGDETVALVAVDDGDGLTVAAEEVSGVDVDQFKDSGVELHLERDGVDVVSVAEHDGDLESAADGLGDGWRYYGEADGQACRCGCLGQG